MALRDRIFQLSEVATEKVAKVAKVEAGKGPTFARIATFAVAAPQSEKTEGDLPAELEQLIQIVGKHYDTPPDEYQTIRETAAKDPVNALRSYRLMALEIEQEAHQGDEATGMTQTPMPELVSCQGCLHHEFDATPGKFNPICKIHAAIPFVRWHAGINVLARGCLKKQDRPQTAKTV